MLIDKNIQCFAIIQYSFYFIFCSLLFIYLFCYFQCYKANSGLFAWCILAMDNLRIVSFNVKELVTNLSAGKFSIFEGFKSRYCIIIRNSLLSKMEKIWRSEWVNNIHFALGETNARGVCIMFTNKSIKIDRLEHDLEGRVLCLQIAVGEETIVICNIYTPNSDCPGFYLNMSCMLDCLMHRTEL